jgi:hypothetical protein
MLDRMLLLEPAEDGEWWFIHYDKGTAHACAHACFRPCFLDLRLRDVRPLEAFSGLFLISQQSEVAQQNPVQIAVTTAPDPALLPEVLNQTVLDLSEGLQKKAEDYLLG